jgi:light-regulated signal transduction histidine kinase (bacteriophytochrome)
LEAANAKLNDANRELEAFAYSVSHDLRAPMRHISGFANLLIGSTQAKLSADDRENLDTIHHTAVTAGRMVDDLLAFSRIGRSQLKTDTVDADAIVATAVRDLAPEIGNRKIEWNIAKLLPMHGDLGLLRLVFQNLLANSVKYTSRREVAHIDVASSAEPNGATYSVKDDGVGFDMAYAHKLFGVFQRLHRAEDFEGTGIGLANVRRIITRHGGRVWAEGKPGEGATFFFYLPNTIPRETAGAVENEGL